MGGGNVRTFNVPTFERLKGIANRIGNRIRIGVNDAGG
jgi:hypothetical protein